MKAEPRKTIIVWAALIAAGALTLAAWSNHKLYAIRSNMNVEETMIIPSPRVLTRLSLGYRGLLADLYWTRAVQYFGQLHYSKALRFDLLYPLLDATVTLDPKLTMAYNFGAVFLAQKPPDGAGMPDAAVQFVERGIRENPQDWRLYYNLGYIHYIERKDYNAAADAFERGSRIPGAQTWLGVMAAYMKEHGGDLYGARFLWSNIYESTTDKLIKENAAAHLASIQVDIDITNWEALLEAYRQRTGRAASSWRELYEAGWMHTTPRDPSGELYILRPDGHVLVADPMKFPYITKGLPEPKEQEQAAPSTGSASK